MLYKLVKVGPDHPGSVQTEKAEEKPLAPSYPVTAKWTFPAPPLDQKIEPLIDLTPPVAGHTTPRRSGFGGVVVVDFGGGAHARARCRGPDFPIRGLPPVPLYCC